MLPRVGTAKNPSSLFSEKRFVPIAVFGLIALILAVLIRSGPGTGVIQEQERRPMPPLKLNLLNGETWNLIDHHGQVVVINYWASWCAPCWQETPMLVRLSHELTPQGLAVVGVAMDERTSNEVPQEVSHFIDTLQVPYPNALLTPMSQMSYGLEGLPTTILIDRKGRVARTYAGAIREATFRADVLALLKEPVSK